MKIKNTTTELLLPLPSTTLHHCKWLLLLPRLSPPASTAAIPTAAAVNAPPPSPSSAVAIVANCHCRHHRSRPSTTSQPTLFTENIITVSHPPLRPPNGTRTNAVPHPSKGGKAYAPEVLDQVGRVMLGASDQLGRQINKSVDTTPLQFKRSAGGKIVGDAMMTALPPPGIRCRPQLPAPSAVSTCTSHSRLAMVPALRGEATTTAAQGRASWWM